MTKCKLIVLSCLAAQTIVAQSNQPTLNARDLFLRTDAASGTEGTGLETRPSGVLDELGIRYSLMKIDRKAPAAYQFVSPSSLFRNGECFALELETNRAGSLYVLAEGSSHKWTAIYPPDTEGQINRITPGQKVRVPSQGCLEFTAPAGVERLFLILLEVPRDVGELVRDFRSSDQARDSETAAQSQSDFASRDLRVQTFDAPLANDEKPFTTYAVAKPPRLFVEVKLKHQ